MRGLVAAVGLSQLLQPAHADEARRESQRESQRESTITVQLSKHDVDVRFEYAAGRDEWGRYLTSRTPAYLQALERYLARPFPESTSFTMQGEDEVWLDGVRVQGYNDGGDGGVHLEYGASLPGNPALAYHELGHFYFGVGQRAGLNWLDEGIVSFLPLAMADAGDLTLTDGERTALLWHWGFGDALAWDAPLEKDFRDEPDGLKVWYRKTFHLQYLLYVELGKPLYRKFVRRAAAGREAGTLRTDKDVLALLGRLKKKVDWRALLTGWLFAGDYVRGWDGFADDDGDGLVRLDEVARGLDPDDPDSDGDGLGDGAEQAAGADPTRAESADEVAALVARGGPVIDGNAGDWKGLKGVKRLKDRRHDAVRGDGYDLTRIRYLVRDDILYVLVETAAPPQRDADVFFDLVTDCDDDGTQDRDFGFRLARPDRPWLYLPAPGETRILTGLRAARQDVLEMAIPLAGLVQDKFRIYPILRDETAGENIDQWNDWIKIRRK